MEAPVSPLSSRPEFRWTCGPPKKMKMAPGTVGVEVLGIPHLLNQAPERTLFGVDGRLRGSLAPEAIPARPHFPQAVKRD
jgi:hypothetical protein